MTTSFLIGGVPMGGEEVINAEEKTEEKEDDFLILEDYEQEGNPDDYIMVRSKVAPVLLPIPKGLLPRVASVNVGYTTTKGLAAADIDGSLQAPPGLPPPVQKALPFATYLEVTLPPQYTFKPDDSPRKNQIATNALIFMLEYIWTHDPTARLSKFPWRANDLIPAMPLTKESISKKEGFPNTAKTVSRYLANCKFQPNGAPVHGRIYLMHSVEISQLLKDLNTKGSYVFAKSQIQAADIASTAWLLGTTSHTNCRELTTALLKTPEFAARPEVSLVLRQKPVKLYLQERPKEENIVFAVHVYTAREHYSFVLETLEKIYNVKPDAAEAEYPVALPAHGKYYVLPDSTSYMAGPETRNKILPSRRHQKAVLRNCTAYPVDLHGLVPYQGSSLLKSQLLGPSGCGDDVSKVLSVDRHPDYAFTYVFSFHQRQTPAAMKAISKIISQLQAEAVERKKLEAAGACEEKTADEFDGGMAAMKDGSLQQATQQRPLVPSMVLWHQRQMMATRSGGRRKHAF